MDRTNYTEAYKNLTKKYGGNQVSNVSAALKKLDAEKDPEKIAALTGPAAKALEAAIQDLKPLKDDANAKTAQKARLFSKDLKTLATDIQNRQNSAHAAAKEGAEAEKKLAEAEKGTGQFASQISTYEGVLVKCAQLCSKQQKEVGTSIEKLNDKRQQSLAKIAKEYGVRDWTSYRGAPFYVITDLAEAAKEGKGKGLNRAKQTIAAEADPQKEKEETSKVKEFLEFAKGQVKPELDALIKDIDEWDDALEETLKYATKAFLLAEAVQKQVKTPKVTGDCNKIKAAVEKLNDGVEKSRQELAELIKIAKKEGGLGHEFGAFGDCYGKIHPLQFEGVNSVLKSLKAELK